MAAVTKAIPYWLFLALVIAGCLAFYPGGLIDNMLTRSRHSPPDFRQSPFTRAGENQIRDGTYIEKRK